MWRIKTINQPTNQTKRNTQVLDYKHRASIAQALKGVAHVVTQDSMDYSDNLKQLKVELFVHDMLTLQCT
jgi:glycerol-3-phosphate cytidylyltransferase-like family protein